MVNRDPYNGLLQSLYNWVGIHPLYNPTIQGFFRGSLGKCHTAKKVGMKTQIPTK